MYYSITTEKIKSLMKEKHCKGIRVIADEKHSTCKTAKTAQRLLVCITGTPTIYRNMNQELTFNFDNEQKGDCMNCPNCNGTTHAIKNLQWEEMHECRQCGMIFRIVFLKKGD